MAFSLISSPFFKLILTSIFILFGSNSYSAILGTSVRIGNSSRAILQSGVQWRVYGSFIGPDEGFSGTTTFDNCDQAPVTSFIGCNKTRVNGSTVLTVSFNDDVQYVGNKAVLVYLKTGTVVGTTNPNLSSDSSATFPQNSTFVGRVTWASLCGAAGGEIVNYATASTALGAPVTACMDKLSPGTPLNKAVQFAVGVAGDGGIASSEVLLDVRFITPTPNLGSFAPTVGASIEGSDGFISVAGCFKDVTALSTGTTASTGTAQGAYSGFCDYNVKPGDDKIRMESNPGIVNTLDIYSPSLNLGSGLSSVPYRGFVLFMSNTGFADTFPWSPGVVSKNNLFRTVGSIESGFEDSSFSSSKIKNEIEVYTRMATLDEAGNITHLFSDAMINSNCGAVPAAGTPAYYRYFVGQIPLGDLPPYAGRCPYATIPSLVTGLLEEDINCFVATALKNSPYDYQVLVLREFRNRFLKSFSLGRSFIDFYYSKGPLAAKWLNENPEFKPVFRVLLWPVYLVAFIFNSLGGFFGLVFLVALLITPMIFWNLRRKTFFHS